MSKRVIYYYERTLSAQVNDIEHIESQSLPRYGVVKVFFQPGVNINAALAQITAASQTVLKYLPPGITPPFVLSFNASSVPVFQLALVEQVAVAGATVRRRAEFHPAATRDASRARRFRRPTAAKFCRSRSISTRTSCRPTACRREDVVNAIGRQNIITPVGTEKVGDFEYVVVAQRLAHPDRRAQRHAHPRRQRGDRFHARRRLRP